MRIVTLGMCAAMGMGTLVGCDESPSTPQVNTSAADSAADKAADAASSAADSAKSAADSAADAAKSAADKAGDVAADAKDKASELGADVLAQVQKLYDDAKASLSQMPPDVDTASKYVDQLKGWQDKLPADWKAKVDELVKTLGEAKDKLKNLPGVPK